MIQDILTFLEQDAKIFSQKRDTKGGQATFLLTVYK
jgi:hypothetical protein